MIVKQILPTNSLENCTEVSLENYFVCECWGFKYYQQLTLVFTMVSYLQQTLNRVVIVERFDRGQREIQQDCRCGLQYIISTDGK